MCGVVACSTTKNNDCWHTFVRLCQQSLIRGVHAFGVSYLRDGRLQTVKSLDFGEVMKAIPNPLPESIIFHNRYATSGVASDMANNQPLVRGRSAIAVNGVVDMGTKSEMETRWGVSLNSDNDAELVLIDADCGDPFKKLGLPTTSLAGAFLSEDGRFFAFRNSRRPLWYIRADGARWAVSTIDIARRAGLKLQNAQLIEPFRVQNMRD